jgi:hypothetical protein
MLSFAVIAAAGVIINVFFWPELLKWKYRVQI